MHICICLQDCPQMALHCYKLALETDPLCVCALYRAVLVYGQVGNTQAEIQALSLLHSVSNAVCTGDKEHYAFILFHLFLKLWHLFWEMKPMHIKVHVCALVVWCVVKHERSLVPQTLTLPSVTEPPHLLSPASLLRSQSLSSLLSVPSAQSVLHTVAQKCALSGR